LPLRKIKELETLTRDKLQKPLAVIKHPSYLKLAKLNDLLPQSAKISPKLPKTD
jgi:hypothetical protein